VIRGLLPIAGGFVAGGSVYPEDRTEPAVWGSADGTAWERVAAAAAPQGLGIEALTELDGLLIAFARTEAGIEVWTSESGETWAIQPDAGAPFAIDGSGEVRISIVAEGGPGLIAFAAAVTPDGGPTLGVWVSADGVTWEAGDVSAFDREVEVYDAVGFGGGVLAVGRLPCDIETCVTRPTFWISPPP
jgi:hypothetical protein